MEGNGHDFEWRLKRLEELIIRDDREFRERFQRIQDAHEDFEKEHKRLLIAQVVTQDKFDKTALLVQEIGERLGALITWSDQVHRDNNERFRRLEERQ